MKDVKNNASTVATSNLYSDLDLLFQPHPVTGDVTRKTDVASIKRAVRNIVLTNAYERPFKPGFGGNLTSKLFELNTDRGIRRVGESLSKTITTFEPRVENVTIRIDEDKFDTNTLDVSVSYSIKNGVKDQSVKIAVTRVR